jgi:hypothetical protein
MAADQQLGQKHMKPIGKKGIESAKKWVKNKICCLFAFQC